MRLGRIAALVWMLDGPAPPQQAPNVVPNANTESAGVLRDGVLTVALEAGIGTWHPEGDDKPGVPIDTFAEVGKVPTIPGPLIRVPRGTEIRLSIHNSKTRPTTFFFPAAVHDARAGIASDSVVVAPGETGTMTVRATQPGNYVYRAMGPAIPRNVFVFGHLGGAVIVDSADVAERPRDRVFVMTELFVPRLDSVGRPTTDGRVIFAINGRSWPNTERISATVGDTLHWRILNASGEIHPMHLHGFAFRVDEFSPPRTGPDVRGLPGRMVVTERMPQLAGMSIAWSPNRAGNWIFHCHFARHIAGDESAEHGDHAMTGMSGLVLGVNVSPRVGARPVVEPAPKRRLRLVAVADTAPLDRAPSMRFVLEERGRRSEVGPAFSPTIELVRGEPVAITVVNHLTQPTSVHWHGIELESYNDGVPGVSGSGTRLSPMIAPRDSFVARFTPSRTGTFMYHSHVDEERQQQAGLEGALIVRERGAVAANDHVLFIKGARSPNAASPIEINGKANPDTLTLRAGRPARLRFLSLAPNNPNASVTITARRDSVFANVTDTMIVQWRQLAKDAFDLPLAERASRAARQIVGQGETFDFEFTPAEAGLLRIEVRNSGAAGNLLARVPIRVEQQSGEKRPPRRSSTPK